MVATNIMPQRILQVALMPHKFALKRADNLDLFVEMEGEPAGDSG